MSPLVPIKIDLFQVIFYIYFVQEVLSYWYLVQFHARHNYIKLQNVCFRFPEKLLQSYFCRAVLVTLYNKKNIFVNFELEFSRINSISSLSKTITSLPQTYHRFSIQFHRFQKLLLIISETTSKVFCFPLILRLRVSNFSLQWSTLLYKFSTELPNNTLSFAHIKLEGKSLCISHIM